MPRLRARSRAWSRAPAGRARRRRPRGSTIPSNRLANLADLTLNEPLDIAYPDADLPGVLLKLGQAVEGGVGPDGDVVGFSILCPHKGYGAALRPVGPGLQLPGPLLALRCRARRPADLGACDPEPAAVPAAGRRSGRHPCRRRRRADLRPAQQRALRGQGPWLTSATSIACRSSRRTPGSRPSSATSASSAAATRRTAGTSTAGRHGAGSEQVRRRPRPAAAARDRGLVRAGDVQHRPPERQGRPPGDQAGPRLRRELRPRLDPRRAAGRRVLLARDLQPDAAPDRPAGLALRPAAADQLGRRAGPGRRRSPCG